MYGVKRLINEFKYYPLNDKQITKMTGLPVVEHSDLDKFKDIDEFFNNNTNAYDPALKGAIIFYPGPENVRIGHWCLIYLNFPSEMIYYMDSYGKKPDENSSDKNLIRLLLTAKKIPIDYCEYKIQQNGPIMSCGYHCANRLALKKYNTQEFKKIMDFLGHKLNRVKFGKTYDDVALYNTIPLLLDRLNITDIWNNPSIDFNKLGPIWLSLRDLTLSN